MSVITFRASAAAVIATCSVASAQLAWQALPAFPGPARDVVAVSAAGKIYVFGGMGNLFTGLGSVFEYDPATRNWSKKKSMPLAAHHLAITEANGKIYAFGGFKKPASGLAAWEAINNSWEYNPATDTWKALQPMPSMRGAASAAVVDGIVYVMGGAGVHPGMKNVPLVVGPDTTPNRSLDTVEEYDIANDSWRSRTTMPTPRNHFALAALNGKLYALGGRMTSAFGLFGSDTPVVEEYDPATNRWGGEKAKMSTPRDSMSWGVYNGRICLVGGGMIDADVSIDFRSAEAYDPVKDQWAVLPSAPLGRAPATLATIGDTLYLLSVDKGYRQMSGERKQSEGSPFDQLSLRLWQ